MGSPIVAGRIASPGSPSSLPYEVPTYGSGNVVDKSSRTRSITESSASSSRGPVSKVMDMFRHRSQSVTSDDKRKVIRNGFIVRQQKTVGYLFMPLFLLAKESAAAADGCYQQQQQSRWAKTISWPLFSIDPRRNGIRCWAVFLESRGKYESSLAHPRNSQASEKCLDIRFSKQSKWDYNPWKCVATCNIWHILIRLMESGQ